MRLSRRSLYSVVQQIIWFIACLGLLLSALALSWHSIARADYLYPLWYQQLSIDEHINTFAPQNNRGKFGLELLPPEEHFELFREIRQAVHHHGQGLESISYSTPSGEQQLLLHADEVVHLQDVARLITLLEQVSEWLMPMTIILVLLLSMTQVAVNWRRQALILFLLVALTIAAILLIGPTHVFYTLHVWIFPPENPWFFYYQDSLMTTLMKAPQLFGAIAIAIALGGLLWLAALLALLWLYQRQLKVWRTLKH